MEATTLDVQISPTDLAGFLRTSACPSYLALRLRKDWTAALRERFGLEKQPLDPLLASGGLAFEAAIKAELEAGPRPVRDLTGLKPWQVAELLATLDEPCILWQVAMEGRVGSVAAYGIADLLVYDPEPEGPRIRVVDVKASAREKVEHRLQVALYVRLLAQMLEGREATLEGAVLCRAEPRLDALVPFDLALYDLALDVLTEVYVPRALREEEPFFNLGPRCAGCEFSRVCLRRASEDAGRPALVGELRDLDLKALHGRGVHTLLELAGLLEVEGGVPCEVSDTGQALLSTWPLGERLPRVVLRAQAIARRLRLRASDPRCGLPRTAASSLPGGPADLLRIYVDVAHDYRVGRLYALSALLTREGEERRVTCLAPAPVLDEAAERALIGDFLAGLHDALDELSGRRKRLPLHLFLCDRLARSALSEGLRRHLAEVGDATFLYDWLSRTSKADELNVSLLMDEVREQRNLGWPIETLYTVSAGLRFGWGKLRERFRRGCFDTAAWQQLEDGGKRLMPVAYHADSGVPLGYAYGAWDALPDDERVADFRVSRDELLGFLGQRLEALRFLATRQLRANPCLFKSPTPLPQRGKNKALTRSEALREFLRLEFGARKEKLLERFRRTPAERVADGYCALGSCVEVRDAGERTRFRLRLLPLPGHQLLRYKEGDLAVLNPAQEPNAEQQGVHKGAIVRLDAVSPEAVEGELLGFGKRATPYRFSHVEVAVREGQLYSIDELVDDLLADRQHEACVRARGSLLHRAFDDGPEAFAQPAPQTALQRAQTLLSFVPTLTERQRVGALLLVRRRLSLLQGPPGTGKSFTLGLAALVLHAARVDDTRLFIGGVTHTSVDIALLSIKRRREELLARDDLPAWLRERLEQLRLVRLVSAHRPGPPDIDSIAPRDEPDRVRELFRGQACVIAGTPSAAHNLAAAYSWPVRWDRELFDAAILDEASQMTVPAALLATAFVVRRQGRLLLVGDHRQMAPIFMHEWQRDRRRSTLDFRVGASVFETLLDMGFERVALDRSFRLHRVLADFIDRAIYQADTRFRSERSDVLAPLEGGDPLVRAALLPDFPLVVIEHGEGMSQHLNSLEVELAARILRACVDELGLCAADGVGVVVPHRAQRAALERRMPGLKKMRAVDTVERYQGGERDVIVLSATASEPHALEAEARFLFSRNRLNVAMSRPRKKLIVMASENLFHFLSADIELFESAALWKLLRYRYARTELFSGEVEGHRVRVLGCGVG